MREVHIGLTKKQVNNAITEYIFKTYNETFYPDTVVWIADPKYTKDYEEVLTLHRKDTP